MFDAENWLVGVLKQTAPQGVHVSLGRPAQDPAKPPKPSISVDLVGGYPHEKNPCVEWLTVSVDAWHQTRGEAIELAGATAAALKDLEKRAHVHQAKITARPVYFPDPDRKAVRYTMTARLLVRVDAPI